MLFPRKNLMQYSALYKDILFIRQYLANILDLSISDSDWRKMRSRGSPIKESAQVGRMQQAFLDSTAQQQSPSATYKRRVLENRSGPVPVWLLHDPFLYDIGRWLDCPLSFPFSILKGMQTIASTTSPKQAMITFGLLNNNLIVVISNLHVCRRILSVRILLC